VRKHADIDPFREINQAFYRIASPSLPPTLTLAVSYEDLRYSLAPREIY
jgi:hypothetical protein